MKLSFTTTIDYHGETFTANVTPSAFMESIVYDVNYQGKIIAVEPHPTENNDIVWVQHLTGETNDLIQAIGEAIEDAEM